MEEFSEMKRIIAILLCLIMAVSAVACNKTEAPAETTAAIVNENPTEAPVETEAPATEAPETEAPVETTEVVEATTEAPAETAPSYEWSSLSAAEQAALKAVMPVALPDFSSYEIVTRAMSFDSGIDDYVIAGNSKGSATFVSEVEGAVYGQAIKMAAKNDSKDDRAEIEVTPLGDMDISTAKGIMFYVDFSNVIDNPEKPMCTSVTINTNKYRAKGAENATGAGIGYYYIAGTWVQTTNVNACRMEIPANFAGWVYIPATSYYGSDEAAGLGETFGDIFVMNMRCYTDGYTYSADNYIIFDEIVFVK